MRRLSFLRNVARFLLAGFLLAQAMLAFAGCEMIEREPAQAVAASGLTCHESKVEANLCLAHCLAEDQSLDKASLPTVAVPPFVSERIAVHVQPEPVLRAAWLMPRPEPPPRILFRTLLI